MAIVQNQRAAPCLTYDEYMREGEITYRYDIIDGVRVVPPAPRTLHQIVQENLTYQLGRYRRQGGQARPIPPPVDILIRKTPLRVRQPDVTLISVLVYRQRNVPDIQGPLDFAPGLVVEIISDSDRKEAFASKIADYSSIGVQECWVVRPVLMTVDVLVLKAGRLTLDTTNPRARTFSRLCLRTFELP